MDEIMAEQKQQEELQQENEVLDKKQLKAAKKLEKKKRKQKNPDDLDGDEETVGGKILVLCHDYYHSDLACHLCNAD